MDRDECFDRAWDLIGEGAIIAWGACISGEIPPLAIVGHQRWRMIGQRDPEHYQRLKESGAFGGPDGVAFSLPEHSSSDRANEIKSAQRN